MSGYYKQVCVKVATDVQYDSIKPVLKEFIKRKISFDIFIPIHKENNNNINTMFSKTNDIVAKEGLGRIIREVSPENQYHLALITPNFEQGISAKYYIKYSYGPAHTVKPTATHRAYRLNRYHGYILHSQRDLEIFGVFSKTYWLPDLKYIGYKHVAKPRLKKPTILFLPSWEGHSNLSWIVSAAKQLKKKYNIVVKLHPYGDHGSDVPESVKKIKTEIQNVSNEYYGGEANLKRLLEHSDLVISDISGAVFDALYTQVPVIIYSKNINKFDLPGVKSACAKYAEEGYISVSKTASELVGDVEKGLSQKYLDKQLDLSKQNFKHDFTPRAVDGWLDVITMYLKDEVSQDYVAMHDLMSSEFWHNKNDVERLCKEIQVRDEKIYNLSSELKSFLGVGRSARLLAGNIKRKTTKLSVRNK